jgi:hypothetical protein
MSDQSAISRESVICTAHWKMIEERLVANGLGAYITHDPDVAMERLQDQNLHGPTLGNFEPMISMQMVLLQNIAHAFGARALDDTCMICKATEIHTAECNDPKCETPNAPLGTYWIERAAADITTVFLARTGGRVN